MRCSEINGVFLLCLIWKCDDGFVESVQDAGRDSDTYEGNA